MKNPTNTLLLRQRGAITTILLGACALWLAACEPLSMTMLSVGAGAGVGHQLNGIVYKTFTEPQAKVKKATLVALKRMDIKVDVIDKIENGESIKAKAADRAIDIELESLTSNTTRMRAIARKEGSILVDSATATEIIGQTERSLLAAASVPPTPSTPTSDTSKARKVKTHLNL